MSHDAWPLFDIIFLFNPHVTQVEKGLLPTVFACIYVLVPFHFRFKEMVEHIYYESKDHLDTNIYYLLFVCVKEFTQPNRVFVCNSNIFTRCG